MTALGEPAGKAPEIVEVARDGVGGSILAGEGLGKVDQDVSHVPEHQVIPAKPAECRLGLCQYWQGIGDGRGGGASEGRTCARTQACAPDGLPVRTYRTRVSRAGG